MMKQNIYATMNVGDWEYNLPGYMQHVLKIADLGDGDHTVEAFIEKISRVEYVAGRDGEMSLFVNAAKLLLVQFADTARPNNKIGPANVPQPAETAAPPDAMDLVESALPRPRIDKR